MSFTVCICVSDTAFEPLEAAIRARVSDHIKDVVVGNKPEVSSVAKPHS
jgi:hypothetical protein